MSDITTPPAGTTPPASPAAGVTPPAVTPPADGGAAPAPAPVDWRSHIKDEAIRNAPFVTQMQVKTAEEAIDALAKQYNGAQKLIGGDKVLRPKADWTPEQIKAWREEALGVPKTSDAYKVDVSKYKDIVDEKALGSFKELFLKHGLTADQVQGVLSDYYEYAAGQYKAQDESSAAAIAAKDAALKKAWGNDVTKNLELMDYAINRVGGDEAKEAIKANPSLLKEPWLANLLVKAGRMASGDSATAIKGGEPATAPVDPTHPVEVRNAISAIRRDPIYEAVVRAGGPSGYTSRMHSEGKGSAEADVQRYHELNKRMTELYKKLG